MKAVNIFFLAFFLYLILYFSKKTNRFFKLFLSIVVGILLIEIVNFLVSMIVPFLAKYIFNIEFSTHAGFALLFNLMVYGTIAWMIIFLGHIFRFGLDASRFKGIWIGIGYILLSGMFSMIILGNPFKELV